ncbi:MAG: ATP synthase subunit F [Lachnospiraceae bacterium]|jgi:V/A-type H+-transporting ATPase subunit F|nr:ATP synthase subunit F [Lachnospiraceae bacterium]
MKMFLISDNRDTYTGMRLAGVEGVVAHERQEVEEAVRRALSDGEIGIILVTEILGKKFSDIWDDMKQNRRLPLLVEIPDRHGTGRKENFITDYVNEAIGLKL